jgi:hypothetical protein
LKEARRIVELAGAHAEAIGVPMSVAVWPPSIETLIKRTQHQA